MDYDQAARKRLGREVRAARTKAGYLNRNDFASKIGRSARQVQSLENGESGVGPDTYAVAAEQLGWPLERVYALLDGDRGNASAPPELATVSDDDLAAEVLRRMREGGGEHVSSAPTKTGDDPDNVRNLSVRARTVGDQPVKRVARRRDGDKKK